MAQALNPAIILVRSQMPENVGAAARAMLNFGFTELRLVAPQMTWPHERAITMAAGAAEVVQNAQVFDTLEEALKDVQVSFATTARNRDLQKEVYVPSDAMVKLQSYGGAKAAFVFGPERTGLENDDLAMMTHLVSIPVSPLYPSLNLAQAVCVMAYEYGRHHFESHEATDKEPLSTHEERTFFNERLNSLLEGGGFYEIPQKKAAMQRKVQTLFERLEPTRSEVQILHGILTALGKSEPLHEKK